MANLNDGSSDWPTTKDTYITESDDPKTAKTRVRASIPNGIYKWIENAQNDLGGSLKGSAADAATRIANIETTHGQVIVAAVDSINKTYADYICDGSDDDVQIQAAIDAMLEDGNGTVLLLPGNYTLGDTIDITDLTSTDRRLRIEGYGATFNCESDPVIDISVHCITHSNDNGTELAGLKIIGDAGGNSPAGLHSGTNKGIRINDSGRVLLKDISVRHCDIGIQTRHATLGWADNFNEAIHIERCYIMCCNQGIVHTNDQAASEASALDGSTIKDCTIIIGLVEAEGETTDACIKFENKARLNRSSIHNCLLIQYYSRNHLYLDASMVASEIDVWCEAAYNSSGSVIYVGENFENGDGFVIKYVITSAESITEISNIFNKKINAMNKRSYWGFGKVNSQGLLTNRDNQMDTAIVADALLNVQALYLFEDGAGDVNDSSDNDYDLENNGAIWGTKDSGWGKLDFDGTDDFVNSGAVMKMDGDRMIICACEPDDAYNDSVQKILFMWYYDAENYIRLQINDGSNQIVVDIERANTYTALTRAFPYAANEVIVFGVLIEGNTCKLFINGEVFQSGSNAGAMIDEDGDFYLGAQYGGGSLFFDGDIFFCGIWDFASEDIIRRLSRVLLSIGCKVAPQLDVKEINTIAANDTTPSVRVGTIFRTSANGGATAITNFNDGFDGQRILVIGGSDTNASTMASGTYLKLSAAMTLGQYDSIELIFDKTNNVWIEIGRTTWDGS
jgi:hypothetical protein